MYWRGGVRISYDTIPKTSPLTELIIPLFASLKRPTLPFDYEIRYSRRKTLGVYVSASGVEVRAPLKASKKWIESFLLEKSDWIQAKLASQQQKAAESFKLAHKETITLLGIPVEVIVESGKRNRVERKENTLVFSVTAATHDLAPVFSRWMKAYAKTWIEPLAYAKARQLGVEYKISDVRFRKTKTKWGHCSSRGVLQFNWLIMMAPEAIVDYLVAHEVSHLIHMNHSPAYWHTVSTICPDYKKLRRWLRDNEHRYRLI